MMNSVKKFACLITVVCTIALTGCATKLSPLSTLYKDTPYQIEAKGSIIDDEKIYNLSELIRDVVKKPNRAQSHRRIFNMAIKNYNWPVALFALTELKRINHNDLRVDYNLACLLYALGLIGPAQSKLSYVQAKTTNVILKNRTALLAMKITNKKGIAYEQILRF